MNKKWLVLAVAVLATSVTNSLGRPEGLEANVSSGSPGATITTWETRAGVAAAVQPDINADRIERKPIVVMPHERSPAYGAALGVIYGVNNGDAQVNRGDVNVNPWAYREINMINPSYLMASNNGYKIWGGTNNASGEFANETGMMIGFPIVVTNTSLSRVRVIVSENGTPAVLNQTITYTSTTYGQARATLNGSVLPTSTPSTTVADRINMVVGVAYAVNSQSTATLVTNHVAAVNPFEITVMVQLLSQDGNTVESQVSFVISTTPPANQRPTLEYARVAEGVRFTVTNGGGLTYNLQASPDLSPAAGGGWMTIGTIGTDPVTIPIGTGMRFFQLQRN